MTNGAKSQWRQRSQTCTNTKTAGENIKKHNGQTAAKLHGKGFGSTDRFLTEIFPTKEACAEHIKEKNGARQAGYEAEITDVESLVRFLYSHNTTTGHEYADYEARNAARKKAKELLGIGLG